MSLILKLLKDFNPFKNARTCTRTIIPRYTNSATRTSYPATTGYLNVVIRSCCILCNHFKGVRADSRFPDESGQVSGMTCENVRLIPVILIRQVVNPFL